MMGHRELNELKEEKGKTLRLTRETVQLRRELAQLKERKTKSLCGMIEDESDMQDSFDILTMLSSTRKTGTWHISTSNGRVCGTLYILEGQIVQAFYQRDSLTKVGEPAIGMILTSYICTDLTHDYSFKRESVESEMFPLRGRIDNPRSLMAYILEAFRIQDEKNK